MLMAHGPWLKRTLVGPKWTLILLSELDILLSITSSWALYIYIYSSQRVTLDELAEWQKVLLLPPRPRSSSIHDVHFLCLQIFSLSSFFASDSIFYPSTFFFRFILASACCVRWSRIASCFVYRLLRRFFCSSGFLSFFFAWIPFTLSTLYTAWCPLVGNTLSFLCFLHFIFAPLNNSINIVFVLFGVYCSFRTTAQYIEKLTYHRPKLRHKTIKISNE